MDGYVTIGTELDTSMIDKQVSLLEDKLEGLVKEYEILEKAEPFEGQNKELIKLGNEIDATRKKLIKLKQQPTIDFSNMGKGIQKVTKKIAKMALAVFGIRSAFMFVRNAINTIAGDDEQLKADIDYMKNIIAYTLEPVVRGIVNLAKQLMYYIGYITKAWTGRNIFEDANQSLKEANKRAKQLHKTISSFDEMNIVSDNEKNKTTAPSFDITAPENVEPPAWIKWIADNGGLVKSILFGIAGGLTAVHLGLKPIKALGIGIALAGLVRTMQKIIDFINDPSFENFIGILEGIALAVTGVAIAIGAWPVAIGAAIAFVIVEIVKHFDQIMEIFNNLIGWLDKNVLGALRYLFGPLGDFLYAPIKWFVELAKGAFEGFFGGIKQWVEGVMKIFKGDFLGGIKDVFGGLLSIMTAPIQGLWKAIKKIVPLILGAFKEIGTKVGEVIGGAFKAVINGVLWSIENILNTPIRAVNGLIGTINLIPGISIPKLSELRLPRLAKGGIVNMPGKGVPVGGAIAGEVSREGVIPLTDSQQMALLGEAIGKYITINANITNTMNGRVISRELQKVQNDSDFAYNR